MARLQEAERFGHCRSIPRPTEVDVGLSALQQSQRQVRPLLLPVTSIAYQEGPAHHCYICPQRSSAQVDQGLSRTLCFVVVFEYKSAACPFISVQMQCAKKRNRTRPLRRSGAVERDFSVCGKCKTFANCS